MLFQISAVRGTSEMCGYSWRKLVLTLPSSEAKISPCDVRQFHCNFPTFFLHVARLSALGAAATVWPTVPAPHGRWWLCSSRNEDWQRKPKDSEKTYLSAILLSTNPTGPDLGRLSYGAAVNLLTYFWIIRWNFWRIFFVLDIFWKV